MSPAAARWRRAALRFWLLSAAAAVPGVAANELHLELPASLEAERPVYRREIETALSDVLARWRDAGLEVRATDVVRRAVVFADEAQARDELAKAFGVPPATIPATFGGTVQEETLYVVSRTTFRPIWTELYPGSPWTVDTYRSLLAHELTHRVHEVVVRSRFGKTSDAMGPEWFFEGLACVGGGQFAAPPMPLAEVVQAVDAERTPPVDYPLYARLVRALLAEASLATLVEHAADPGFPKALLLARH